RGASGVDDLGMPWPSGTEVDCAPPADLVRAGSVKTFAHFFGGQRIHDDHLVTGGGSCYDRHSRAADSKGLGEKLDERGIRLALFGRRGDRDLQCAAVL